MQNFSLFNYRIWITVFFSLGLGLFWNIFSPIFAMKPILLLAMPCAALLLLLMVTKPIWMIVSILVSRPLLDIVLNMTRVNTGGGDGVGLGAIINLTIILLAIFLCFYYTNFPQKIAPISAWIFYLICMLIAVFYSPSRADSARLWINEVSYFSLFLIPFLIIKDSKDFIFWLKVLALSFVLPIMYANIDLLHGGKYFEDAGMRITGSFTHPNILAFYLVLAFTFYFYLLKSGHLKSKHGLKFVIKLLMINILVLLIATKTRNAWISIYAGFFIYALLQERRILWLLVIVVPLFLLIPQVQERMTVLNNTSSSNYQRVNSFEWRLQMWKNSFSKIMERPVQGHGLGAFKPMSEQFSANKKTGAHNTYLELIFETGVIGFLSFMLLFLSPLNVFFKNMTRTINSGEARVWALMISYIIGYMLICSADNLLFYLVFNWYAWFFIGLMLVASYRKYPVYV